MKLRYLKLVKTVADTGSLSKAGEKLFLSQPALSHQLRELEEYCKAPVFKRIGKKMIINKLGNKILQTADNVFVEIEQLEKDIESMTDNNRVKLTLASSCYTGYYWLPPIIKEFCNFFPDGEINISHEATDDPVLNILNGTIDLAIVSRKIRDTNLVFTEAFADQLFVIVPHGHKWKNRKYVKVKEFKDEDVIIYPRPITAFQQLLKSEKIVPKKVIKVQLTEARIEMVKAGLGVSVMANWAIKPYLDRREVLPVKITGQGLHRVWYAAYLKNLADTEYIKKFIEILKLKMLSLLSNVT